MATKKSASNVPHVKIQKSEDFQTFYINWVQMGVTPWEISLVAGQAFAAGADNLEAEQKARLVFSPLQGKIILAMLEQTLQSYETQFGEVKIPEGMLQNSTANPGGVSGD